MGRSWIRSGVATVLVVVVLVAAVGWTWPGGDLEAYRGQIEIAEVQNNRTDRAEISVLTVQPEGVRGAEVEIVVDALRVTLDPGSSQGSTLLACTDGDHVASTLKVVVESTQGAAGHESIVPLRPADCRPGGGASFPITAVNGAVVIDKVE